MNGLILIGCFRANALTAFEAELIWRYYEIRKHFHYIYRSTNTTLWGMKRLILNRKTAMKASKQKIGGYFERVSTREKNNLVEFNVSKAHLSLVAYKRDRNGKLVSLDGSNFSTSLPLMSIRGVTCGEWTVQAWAPLKHQLRQPLWVGVLHSEHRLQIIDDSA